MIEMSARSIRGGTDSIMQSGRTVQRKSFTSMMSPVKVQAKLLATLTDSYSERELDLRPATCRSS